MRRIAYVLAAAAAFGTVTAPRLFAGDPPAASAEEQERIARLVEDLGSADFRVREAATKALIEFGAKARPALEKAVTSDNPAVRFRADQLLQGLDGKKGEQKLGEDARPGRSQPGAGGSTRDDVQRSVERSQREMEQAIREMREKWNPGRFDEQMKEMEKQLREFQEQMEQQFGGAPFGGAPFGGSGGPNVRVVPGWLEPWVARARVARGIDVSTEADGTTLTLSDRPNRAKLEVRSTKDRSAVATFTASSVDALFAAYPAVRTWPGVAELLEKHAVAKAEREKVEADARKQAETAPRRPTATNRSVSVESSDGHVKVTIAETGADGKPVTKTYEGTDLETLKAQHPELREALGGFSLHFGPGTTFGPGFGPGGPFGPGAGPRVLEEDDGDGDEDLAEVRRGPQTGPFGLALGDVDDDLRAHLGLPEGQGAYVVLVRAGSDAAKLGLEAKDVIVRVNDTVVKALGDVGTAVRAVPEGGALTIEVLRAGKAVTLKR